MASVEDRFIAYVCDAGPLTLDEMVERVGATARALRGILRWVDSGAPLARESYEKPIRDRARGTIEVRSRGTWREPYLIKRGLVPPGGAPGASRPVATAAAPGTPVPPGGPPGPHDTLAAFLAAVRAELEATSDEMLRLLWGPTGGAATRACFYATSLWPRVACHWTPPLRCAPGLLGLDQALLRPEDGTPLILIGSEAAPQSIVHGALPRLCDQDGLLAVVLSSLPWSGHPELPDTERQGAEHRDRYLREWAAYLRHRSPLGTLRGVYAFLVAEGYPEDAELPGRGPELLFRWSVAALDGAGQPVPEPLGTPVLHERRLPARYPPPAYVITAAPLLAGPSPGGQRTFAVSYRTDDELVAALRRRLAAGPRRQARRRPPAGST